MRKKAGFWEIGVLLIAIAVMFMGSCDDKQEPPKKDFNIVGTYKYTQSTGNSSLTYTWVFKADKKYEITRSIGSAKNTGSYSVSGDEITITTDPVTVGSQNAPSIVETFAITESGNNITLKLKEQQQQSLVFASVSIVGTSLTLSRSNDEDDNKNTSDDFDIVGTYKYTHTSDSSLIYTWVFYDDKEYAITRSKGTTTKNTGSYSVSGDEITITTDPVTVGGLNVDSIVETFTITESGNDITLKLKVEQQQSLVFASVSIVGTSLTLIRDINQKNIYDFHTWLLDQPSNTAANPYTYKLNVNDLKGSSIDIIGSVGWVLRSSGNQYVILDLSDSTITSIGEKAFQSCRLTGVTIPSSVTSIERWAFNYCESLTSVTFAGTIPSSDFVSSAFYGDLRAKFYATDATNGTPGTYTTTAPVGYGSVWTKL
jgi:predicted secreted protein